MHTWLGFTTLALCYVVTGSTADPKSPPAERGLFDFEDPADFKVWTNLELPDAKAKEPPAKIALSTDHATSGKHSLKITFAGGRWPTITTTQVAGDWLPYQTFQADVTVSRSCLVGFTALQEKSQRGGGWDGRSIRASSSSSSSMNLKRWSKNSVT
jgi:hypothetical protein